MAKKIRKRIDSLKYLNPFCLSNKKAVQEIIIEFMNLNISNGLVVGTNAVLRQLEKKNLAAVLLYTFKASSPIYHTLSLWCKQSNVLFISLTEEDEMKLENKLPKSITYGIIKDVLKTNQNLARHVKELSTRERQIQTEMLEEKSPKIIKHDIRDHAVSVKINDLSFLHHKKDTIHQTKTDYGGNFGDFISLTDISSSEASFPDYTATKNSKISFSIK